MSHLPNRNTFTLNKIHVVFSIASSLALNVRHFGWFPCNQLYQLGQTLHWFSELTEIIMHTFLHLHHVILHYSCRILRKCNTPTSPVHVKYDVAIKIIIIIQCICIAPESILLLSDIKMRRLVIPIISPDCCILASLIHVGICVVCNVRLLTVRPTLHVR